MARKVKQVILAGIVAGLIAAALLLPIVPWLVCLFESVGDLGLWGPVALGGLYIVSCVFLIPASIPTPAAGPSRVLLGRSGGDGHHHVVLVRFVHKALRKTVPDDDAQDITDLVA